MIMEIKKIKIAIIIFIISLIITHLLFSFIIGRLNPMNYSIEVRALEVFVFVFMNLFANIPNIIRNEKQ